MEQDFSLIAQARQTEALARRTRVRAWLDGLAVAVVTLGAAIAGGTAHQALMAGSAALSLGILFYVIRRDRDLTALAGQVRWREEAVKGRGLSIQDWHGGVELEPWDARRKASEERSD